MELIILVICLLSFLWWGQLALEWWIAAGKGEDLADMPQGAPPGRLSIIVPARNEEKGVEAALNSLLANLPETGEVIMINDRSTDRTGTIAREVAARDRRLRVIDILDLPDGWLGKTHAMYQGYLASSGDLLLFTDADVLFERNCLDRAVRACLTNPVDHLVATPYLVTEGFWEKVFVLYFSILLVSRFRIWRASDPGSRFYAGIGAFNLVTRQIYEKAGTHEAIRAEVVDDLELGRLIKRAGGRTRVLAGERCLRVRWNEGLGGLIRGLEKNAFAGLEYSLVNAAAGGCGLVLTTLVPAASPFVWLFSGDGVSAAAAAAGLGVWAAFAALYAKASRASGGGWIYFITFPAASVLLTWTILRSALLYYVRGGVKWRDTVYRGQK